MTKVNIFDKVDYETNYDYFKFSEVGDKVQGTYVSRNDNTVDGYNNAQTLVGLLQEDGTVKTVSIRHNKIGLLEELNKVSLGQIIGFIFTGTKENPGKQPTKFIKLVHDPKYVDEAWLKERESQQKALNNPTAGMTPQQIFPDEVKETPQGISTADLEASLTAEQPAVMSDSDKIKEIANLAKEKLAVSTTEEVKAKVLEKTGLDLVTSNLDAILEKLKAI